MPRTRAARAKAASARGARDLLIMLLTVPWCLLGPANIFKIAVVNRGSPVAKSAAERRSRPLVSNALRG